MSLIGFQRIGDNDDPDASWVIPSTLSADQLKQALDLIKKIEFSPPLFDDGREAGDLIRRKSAGAGGRRREVFDDEDHGIDDEEDEELFPMGGPTAMKKSDALEELKKTRRRRRKEGSGEDQDNGPTDEQLKARADARRARELEKHRKIKSELFVHDSDEESDEERDRAFFEAEEKLRERSKIAIMKELLGVRRSNDKPAKSTKTTKSSAISADSDDDEILMTRSRKRQSSAISVDSDDDAVAATGWSSSPARDDVLAESDNEATDTPMSSPHVRSSQTKRRKISSYGEGGSPDHSVIEKGVAVDETISEDEEDALPIARPARQRVRAGFIVDSSDEE
jgi:replication fork protection complex subunit Tof1/Swi1